MSKESIEKAKSEIWYTFFTEYLYLMKCISESQKRDIEINIEKTTN